MSIWRQTIQSLRLCGRSVVIFDLIYELLLWTVVLPVQSWLIRGAMAAAGCAYLTVENFGRFLRSPVTWLALAAVLVTAALAAVVEMGGILTACARGRSGLKTGVTAMAAAGARAARSALRRGNLPSLALALAMMPLLNLGLAAGCLATVALPQALIERLLRNRRMLVAAILAVAALLATLLRWLYAFPIMVSEGVGFREARRRSAAMSRGGRLRDGVSLLLLQLAGAAAMVLTAAAVLAGLVPALAALLPDRAGQAVSVGVLAVLAVLLFLFTVVETPLLLCWLDVRSSRRREAAGFPPPPPPPDGPRLGDRKKAMTAVWVLTAVCAAVGVVRLVYDSAAFRLEYLSPMEVTAHRGASAACPENTMPAFREAVEQGADWIELDVRRTRDGALVVLHDETLLRTTGDPRRVQEVDAAEVAQLDAGSWFSPEYAGTPIPRLEEVLAFASETGVRLNIELKPSGDARPLAKAAAELVQAYGLEEQCVLASPSYEVLEAVRAYAPELRTLYVMAVAYGDLLRLDAADAFSVRDVNVTANLVNRLHNGQKTLWVWTVNSRSTVDKMFRLGVDNVITDRVPMAREQLYEGRTTDWVRAYIQGLERIGASAGAENEAA